MIDFRARALRCEPFDLFDQPPEASPVGASQAGQRPRVRTRTWPLGVRRMTTSRGRPAGHGGTTRPTPTSTSTGLSSARPASSGVRRVCRSPRRGCSATCGTGGFSRSGAARPSAPDGCWRLARTRSVSTSRRPCSSGAATSGAATGLDVPLVQADATQPAVRRCELRSRLLGLRRRAIRRRLGRGDG